MADYNYHGDHYAHSRQLDQARHFAGSPDAQRNAIAQQNVTSAGAGYQDYRVSSLSQTPSSITANNIYQPPSSTSNTSYNRANTYNVDVNRVGQSASHSSHGVGGDRSALGRLGYGTASPHDSPRNTGYQQHYPSSSAATSLPQPVQPQASYGPVRHSSNATQAYTTSQSQARTYGESSLGTSDALAQNQVAYPRTQQSSPQSVGNATNWIANNTVNMSQSTQQRPTAHSPQNVPPGRPSTSSTSFPQANTSSKRDSGNPPAPEPTVSATVDPAQVYDSYHEFQRRAAQRPDISRAPPEASSNPRRDLNTQATPPSVPENGTPKVKAKAKRTPRPRKTPVAKTASNGKAVNKADTEAAMTLMQTANGTVPDAPNNRVDLEAQMREMFKKMREFNQKDPDMLARLWQQERDDHLAKEGASADTSPKTPAAQQKQVSAASNAGNPGSSKSKGKTTGSKSKKADSVTASLPKEKSKAKPTTTAVMPASNAQPATPIRRPGPKSASVGTIWPAEKKAAVAAAATRVVTEDPKNKGLHLTADKISDILDTNPTYVELCLAIERLGFSVDRLQLAKGLVRAVPDVNRAGTSGSSGASTSAKPSRVDAANGANAKSSNSRDGLLSEAENRLMNGQALIATNPVPNQHNATNLDGQTRTMPNSELSRSILSPTADIRTPNMTQVASNNVFDQQPSARSEANEDAESQQKNTKKSSAKSTAKSKTTVASPPAPLTKEDQARKRNFSDLVDLTIVSDDDDMEIVETSSFNNIGPVHDQAGSSQNAVSGPSRSENTTTQSSTVQLPASVKGPRPLVGNDALTSSLNGNGISSAVPSQTANLPASQVPQNNAPPPQHTAPAVDQPANAVPFPKIPVVPHDHPLRTIPVASRLDKSKALRRSGYNPKTIARDVLLACGRHLEMRSLNKHYETLRMAFPALKDDADLSTIRWDLLDPGGPPVGSAAAPQSHQDDLMDGAEADDEDEIDNTPRVQNRSSATTAGPGGGTIMVFPTTPHIGRPRKHFKGANGARMRAEGSTGQGQTSTPPSGASPMTYAQLREAEANSTGQLVKKRGRPVGWRKWMQKGGTAGPSNPAPKVSKDPPPPDPVYHVYRCEWKECGAELHNIRTLRKHVHKLHGKFTNGKFVCLWSGCGTTITTTDPDTDRVRSARENFSFDSQEAWRSHVEREHVLPIAWRLGDGPTDGVSDHNDTDPGSESYMSDSRGRRVTPTVHLPYTSGSGETNLKRKKTAEEKAREDQSRLEQKRRGIGPGIDKGGATFVNDKRRQGFVDDDDAEMVLEEDG